MARTTISIPDDLRQRMDQVDGERVNWSALAAQAFEAKLAEIIGRKGPKDMKDVIARLRASKTDHVNQDRKDGYEAGRRWAEASAEAIELKRLSEVGGTDDYFDDDSGGSAYGACEVFVFTIQPENVGDRGRSNDFWEMHGGKNEGFVEPPFVRGFAEGALDIWGSVVDLL